MKKFTILSIAIAVLGMVSLNAQVTYSDNFSEAHDYVADGVAGTIWHGYKVNSSGNQTADPINNTTVDNFEAVNGGLLIYTNMGNFEHELDDGAYIYRTVPGGIDFEAQVKITDGHFISYQDTSSYYNSAGIVVRNPDTTAQNNLYFMFFEIYNIHSMIKSNADGTQTELVNSMDDYAALSAYPYMKASRVGNLFTLSVSPDGFSWTTTVEVERADLEGVDLQVGLTQNNFWSDVAQSAVLDDFKLTHAEVASVNKNELAKFKVYSYNGQVIIESEDKMIQSSKLFSIDGREVASQIDVKNNRCEFNNLKSGLYITVVNIDGVSQAKKVVIQ